MNNEEVRSSLEQGAEIVYGTHDDNNMVMSEKVNTTFISLCINCSVFYIKNKKQF